MKFSVEKQVFLEKIALVYGIAEKKTTMPILSTLLLTSSKDQVKITATDLETTISTWMDAEVEKESSIAVPAHTLFDIVKGPQIPPNGNITVEEIGNSWVHLVTDSGGDYKIAGLPASDYPDIPDVSKSGLFEIDPDLLEDMISKTIYCVSSDDMRRNLSGICFEKSGENNLRLVATDGHRLSRIEKTLSANISISTVLVPRKGLSELIKVLKSISSKKQENKDTSTQGDTVQIGCEKKFFVVAGEDVLLFSRLIDAEFPDYKQVIPDETEFEVEVDRISLLNSLKGVGVLSSERTRNMKTIFDDNVLTIASSSPEVGEGKETIQVNYTGSRKEIGFSGSYLVDCLSAIDQDKVFIRFTDELSPVLLKPKDKDDYLCIVMPMRI